MGRSFRCLDVLSDRRQKFLEAGTDRIAGTRHSCARQQESVRGPGHTVDDHGPPLIEHVPRLYAFAQRGVERDLHPPQVQKHKSAAGSRGL